MSKTRRKPSNDTFRQLQAFKRKKNDLSAPVDWEEDVTLHLQNLKMPKIS